MDALRKNMNNLLLAAAMATCVMQVATATIPAAVALFPQTVVQGEKILLADIAAIEGLQGAALQALQQVEIASAPPAGETTRIDVEQVRRAMSHARVNLATLCIGGAASCNVYRPGTPDAAASAATAPARAGEPGQESPHTVEAAVRNALRERLAQYPGQVEIRFAVASRAVLGLGGQGTSFHVRPRGAALLGLLSMDVDLMDDGRPARTVPVMAEAALTSGVIVARRPINRGSMIRPEDIGIEPRRFTRVEDIGLLATAAAVGRQAKRYIDQNEMLTARDVQAMPLVRRGEYVTVWLRRGGLSIRGSAKALKDGTQGERIEVRGEPAGQTYAVVVTGPRTVEADPAGGDGLLSRAN